MVLCRYLIGQGFVLVVLCRDWIGKGFVLVVLCRGWIGEVFVLEGLMVLQIAKRLVLGESRLQLETAQKMGAGCILELIWRVLG